MKLLTPTQNVDATNAEEARGILRLRELAAVEQEYREKLARAEADFNTALAKNRKIWEDEEQAHAERKKHMAQEIDQLEVQKLQMLVPFEILKKGSDDRFKDAESFLQSLREREARVEDLTDEFENRLDDLGEREETIKQKEQRYVFERKGLDIQIDLFKTQSAGLTEQMRSFYESKVGQEKELSARKEALLLEEKTFIAREEGIKDRELGLSQERMRLNDERGVLQRAWGELRRMQ